MNRDIYILLAAQFLTAFADNAILFTAVTMAMHLPTHPPWYVPALQVSFLVAFVLLAPWVGRYADTRSKSTVLVTANLIKGAGAALMLTHVDPLLSYAVVGVGAAAYSPAKYGILPELVPHSVLVRANGWIESTTIVAILTGSLGGAVVADRSVAWALILVMVLYLVSALSALLITRIPPRHHEQMPALRHFAAMIRTLLSTRRARFVVLGDSLFWATGAVLRVLLVAWAPVVLLVTDTAQIAELTTYLAIGVAFGAVLAARLIPMEHLRRARFAAYLMGLSILALGLVESVWPARLALLAGGMMGGLFMVPINATLQEIGHRSIGSGGAVAVQAFFENLAMMTATGLYGLAAAQGAQPVASMVALGALVVTGTFVLSLRLPPDSGGAKAVRQGADDTG